MEISTAVNQLWQEKGAIWETNNSKTKRLIPFLLPRRKLLRPTNTQKWREEMGGWKRGKITWKYVEDKIIPIWVVETSGIARKMHSDSFKADDVRKKFWWLLRGKKATQWFVLQREHSILITMEILMDKKKLFNPKIVLNNWFEKSGHKLQSQQYQNKTFN